MARRSRGDARCSRNCAREPEVGDLADCCWRWGHASAGRAPHTIEVEGVEGLHGACHSVIPDRIEAGTYVIAGALCGDASRSTAVARSTWARFFGAGGSRRELQCGCGQHRGGATPTTPSGRRRDDRVSRFACRPAGGSWRSRRRRRGVSEVTEAIFESRFQHALELMRLGARIEVAGRTARIWGPTPLTGATVMASDLRASAAWSCRPGGARGRRSWTGSTTWIIGTRRWVKLGALGAAIERFNPGPYQ